MKLISFIILTILSTQSYATPVSKSSLDEKIKKIALTHPLFEKQTKKTTLAHLNSGQQVEFINFEVNLDDEHANIFWSTSIEVNNDFFTVERSRNGRKWKPILTADGAGNSNQIIQYFETDYSPYRGTCYYRLKQTTFAGSYSYSQVIEIQNRRNKNNSLNLYPNPVKRGETVNVELNNILKSEILVVLRDIAGKEYYSKLIINVKNNQLMGIPIGMDLPKGIYLITATSEDQIQGKKLIIQ